MKDEADRIRREQELARFDAEIRVKQVERVRVEENLAQQQRKALRDLASERVALDVKILESQGRRRDAALNALDEEIRKTEELLRKQGLAESERARILGGIRERGVRDIDLEEVERRADVELRGLQLQRELVSQRIARGQIFAFEGEQEIIAIERARLPVLKEIANEMMALALATGDAMKIHEAQEFAAAIGQIEVNIDKAGREMAQFQEQAFDALVSNTTDFFSRGIDEAENFAEAIKGLARSIFQDLRQLAAKDLSRQIWESIFGTVRGGGAGGWGGHGEVPGSGGFNFASIAAGIAKFFAFAEGGKVRGPGGSTGDRVPALLSDGEFVMRAAAVRNIGADLLSAMNAGMRPVSIVPMERRLPHFAEGGLVGGAAAKTSLDSSLTVRLGPGLLVDELHTPEGQRALVQAIERNKRSVRGAIGT